MVDPPSNFLDVRPGDEETVDKVEAWFLDYQATHDPAMRERIILAHLGVAGRLAMRFRGDHGVAAEDLVQAARAGRSPTLTEIGDHLGVGEERVAEALETIDTRHQLSLDQPIDEDKVSFGSLLAAPAGEIELEDRLSLPDLLDGLGELERQAVVMRFFQDLKQKQIGTELGYPQMHVSRVLRRALRQMPTSPSDLQRSRRVTGSIPG